MIPKFVIPLLYVFVLVSTDDQEVEINGVKKSSLVNIATNLEHHFTTNNKVQQDGSVGCQHGPAECYGNKLHACAIDNVDDIILAVIFNGCMMDRRRAGEGSDDAAADECGSYLGLDSEPIKLCARGPKGEELLKFYGDESKKVDYEGVPTVLINGVPGNTDDFRSDVCNSFEIPPKPCRR